MENKFILDKNKITSNAEYKYYTLIGQHSEIDEEGFPVVNKEGNSAFAKKMTNDGKTRFFIKVGTHGKIYNPIGLYSEGTSNKFLARAGKKAWDFKEVNSKVFDMYINFLRTKNTAWLTNAQREI